jgi:hypothetical protein
VQNLEPIAGHDLQWIRPKPFRSDSELRAGDRVVATLRWIGGSRAEGGWSGGSYRFSRAGWLRPRVVVVLVGAASDAPPAATFTYRHGVLTLASGAEFHWAKASRRAPDRAWCDTSGNELVRFSPQRGGVAVRLSADAGALPELALLLLLGQYLLMLSAQDAAVATSAAIVPIISG